MTEIAQSAIVGVPAGSRLARKRNRFASWLNSPKRMGTVVILASVIGGIAEAGSGLIATIIRPEQGNSQAYLQAADRLVAQLAADRNDVLQILNRMDERDAETHRALLSRQQIEVHVNNMYVNGSSLKEVTEAAAAAASGREAGPIPEVRVAPRASVDVPPRSRPSRSSRPSPSPAPVAPPSPPPASNLRIFITNGVGGGRAILKTPLTGAERADLWLRPGESRVIDTDLNVSFGVSADGPTDADGRISVVVDGRTSSILPGEVVRYQGSTGNCFVIYLRAEAPDQDRSRDGRHAFALQCAPERERW